MEKPKPARKITEWNSIALRYNRRPKFGWRNEMLNDLKNLKMKNWTYLVKDINPPLT
jgi:hypothetical protein